MSDWHLQAFHDPRAEPVADMWLQSSSEIEKGVDKLAIQAGLDAPNMRNPYNGRFFFQNGEIQAKRHYYNR